MLPWSGKAGGSAPGDRVHARIPAAATAPAFPGERVSEWLARLFLYNRRMSEPSSIEGRLGALLRTAGLTLATAESCTGGRIADRITNIPGASEYFLGGFVAYAYEAKVAELGVSWDTLRGHGAVSKATVLEMARGARLALGASLALAVTGIAGPGGGLAHKPVGTTWIGLASETGEWAREFRFRGDRTTNKSSAADEGLQLVLDFLERRLH